MATPLRQSTRPSHSLHAPERPGQASFVFTITGPCGLQSKDALMGTLLLTDGHEAGTEDCWHSWHSWTCWARLLAATGGRWTESKPAAIRPQALSQRTVQGNALSSSFLTST